MRLSRIAVRGGIPLLAALGALCAAASCTIVNGLHVPDDASSPIVGEAGPADGGVDADMCEHAVVPLPPDPTAGADGPEIIAVIRSVDLGEGREGQPEALGRDVDYKCTCHPKSVTGSCTPGGPTEQCDDVHGRDNNVAVMLDRLATASSLSGSGGYSATAAANSAFAGGQDNLVLRVQGYNGQPDDANVQVAFLASNGARNDDGTPLKGAPDFDNVVNKWAIVSTSFLGDPPTGDPGTNAALLPKVVDRNAYVVNNVVVAHLDVADIRLAAGLVTHLTGVTLTATLAKKGSDFVLTNGLLTARWSVADALTSLAQLQISSTPTEGGAPPLCDQSDVFGAIRDVMCKLVDVTAQPAADDTNQPCDALSLGMATTMSPAKLGLIETLAPATNQCGGRTFSCDGGT